MTEVFLAIYDLSRGMARSLSAQFLGPQYAIDVIPHTGIVCFGVEYFFGAGIQSEEPHAFRRSTGMFPFQILSLGRTTVSQAQFEQWCLQQMQSGQYSAHAYDLLTRNCNNFSHDAALNGLRLAQGVPDWVLDVPRKFLASPMGQMVRPMLDNMQLGNVEGAHSVGAPFSNAAPALAQPSSSTLQPSSVTPHGANPWANLPTSQPTATPPTQSTTPLLDSFNKPLFSNDLKTVSLCTKKVLSICESDVERAALENVGQRLSRGENIPETSQTQLVCALLQRCLDKKSCATFALMFLRILVLKSFNACRDLIKVVEKEVSEATQKTFTDGIPPARAMAWLVLGNALGTEPSLIVSSLDDLVHEALQDLSDNNGRGEVRQAASSFLYNAALHSAVENELSDLQVTLLCATLESLPEETDSSTALHRLMTAGRIIKPVSEDKVSDAASNLARDLGFVEALSGLKISMGNAERCRKLALEIATLLGSN